MFTGIIEKIGKVTAIQHQQNNIDIWVESEFTPQLKVDQSIAHNGVCLTVVEINNKQYRVTIIAESINRSNLGNLMVNDLINLERCMPMNGRLDGHIVQGHVDCVGHVKSIQDQSGSFLISIQHPTSNNHITVPKGSVCINGVSLTVVDSGKNHFSVAIIPYTWQHTNLQQLSIGSPVNLEFDIIGKYISKLMPSNL